MNAWRGAFTLAFAASLYFLLAPASAVPASPPFPLADKLEHAALFAILGVTAARAFPARPAWAVLVALSLYGAATEAAQSVVPGRSTDALDWLADSVGALAGGVTPRRAAPSTGP